MRSYMSHNATRLINVHIVGLHSPQVSSDTLHIVASQAKVHSSPCMLQHSARAAKGRSDTFFQSVDQSDACLVSGASVEWQIWRVEVSIPVQGGLTPVRSHCCSRQYEVFFFLPCIIRRLNITCLNPCLSSCHTHCHQWLKPFTGKQPFAPQSTVMNHPSRFHMLLSVQILVRVR